jgi:hypothetical protein
MSFAAISLCLASQQTMSKVRRIFRYDSVRKRLDTFSYFAVCDNRWSSLVTIYWQVKLVPAIDRLGQRNFKLHGEEICFFP